MTLPITLFQASKGVLGWGKALSKGEGETEGCLIQCSLASDGGRLPIPEAMSRVVQSLSIGHYTFPHTWGWELIRSLILFLPPEAPRTQRASVRVVPPAGLGLQDVWYRLLHLTTVNSLVGQGKSSLHEAPVHTQRSGHGSSLDFSTWSRAVNTQWPGHCLRADSREYTRSAPTWFFLVFRRWELLMYAILLLFYSLSLCLALGTGSEVPVKWTCRGSSRLQGDEEGSFRWTPGILGVFFKTGPGTPLGPGVASLNLNL